MNIFKIIKSASVVFLLGFIYSCNPIEDRDVLTNSFSPDNIALEASYAKEGGNVVSIKMNTPAVTGYWDYLLDQKSSDQVDNIIFPFTGEHTLRYYVTTPYMPDGTPAKTEYVYKDMKINITRIDTIPPAYLKLVGKALTGKTWVFDGKGSDGGVWWAMTDPANINAIWWNAGGDCCPPDDALGRMVFDVTGGLNITTYASPDAVAKKGSYSFNSDFTKLTIKGGTNIIGSDNPNSGNNKVFSVIELTDTKLTLWVQYASGGTGWIWKFKAQ